MDVGQEIGPYRILRPIGKGGMGVVYLAHHATLDRQVAIKVLPPRDDVDVRRFHREMQLATALEHPALVKCFDVETRDGADALVLEYVDGWDLAQVLKRQRRLPWQVALGVAGRLADGLAYLHQRGVIHRDIKPANVLISREGQVKLTDFGVAVGLDTTKFTETGAWIGTVNYMAPECFRGQSSTQSSDLWSLGATLYQLLTGRSHVTPTGDGLAPWVRSLDRDPIQPAHLVESSIPVSVSQLVGKLLERDPSRRLESAQLLKNRIDSELARVRTSVDQVLLEAALNRIYELGPPMATPHRASLRRFIIPLVLVVMGVLVAAWMGRREELSLNTVHLQVVGAINTRDFAGAERMIQAGLNNNFAAPALFHDLFMVYISTGRKSELLSVFNTPAFNKLSEVDRHTVRSEAYAILGRYPDCHKELKKAIAIAPKSFELRRNLIIQLAVGGQTAQARDQLRITFSLGRQPCYLYEELGHILESAPKTGLARMCFEEGLKNHPGDPGLTMGLARTLTEEDPALAEKLARGVLKSDDAQASHWSTLSLILCAQQRNLEALGAIRQAVKREPANTQFRRVLVSVDQRCGDYDQQVEDILSVLKLDPSYMDEAALVVFHFAEVSEIELAESLGKRLLALVPGHERLESYLVQLLVDQGRSKDAEEWVRQNHPSIPPKLADIFKADVFPWPVEFRAMDIFSTVHNFRRAGILFSMLKHQQKLKNWEAATTKKLSGQNLTAWESYLLGETRMQLGRDEEGLKCLKAAAAQEPKDFIYAERVVRWTWRSRR